MRFQRKAAEPPITPPQPGLGGAGKRAPRAGGLLKGRGPKQEKKSGASRFVETVVIVVIALGLALGIQAFIVKPYRIPSESMEPTLSVGQRVLVNRLESHLGGYHVGQIVVFHPPQGAVNGQGCGVPMGARQPCTRPTPQEATGTNFIKRIVAGPGDRIAVVNEHAVLNGKTQKETFVQTTCPSGSPREFPTPITVPPGMWFMMGDNRECSDDSRFWGPVPSGWIIGNAFATYWPPDRIGIL